MPKKAEPLPFKDSVTGVACVAYPNFNVKVGVGSEGITLEKACQFTRMRNEETRDQAVARYHDKIHAALALMADAGKHGSQIISLKYEYAACKPVTS